MQPNAPFVKPKETATAMLYMEGCDPTLAVATSARAFAAIPSALLRAGSYTTTERNPPVPPSNRHSE